MAHKGKYFQRFYFNLEHQKVHNFCRYIFRLGSRHIIEFFVLNSTETYENFKQLVDDVAAGMNNVGGQYKREFYEGMKRDTAEINTYIRRIDEFVFARSLEDPSNWHVPKQKPSTSAVITRKSYQK